MVLYAFDWAFVSNECGICSREDHIYLKRDVQAENEESKMEMNICHPPVVCPLLLSCKLRFRFICQSIIWYPCIKHICFWIKWYWLLKSSVFLSQWTLSYPNCKQNLWYHQSGIHANHSVTNLNLIFTSSIIISLKSSLIICFANSPYNIFVWAECNNLSRETY